MATTAADPADKLSCYGSLLAFLNGPDYYVTTGNTLERERPPSEQQVEFSAPSAQVAVSARSTAQLQPKSVDVCPSSPTAIKVRAKSKAPSKKRTGPTTEGFDNNKQVYTKEELSPLPFQPPLFYTYITTMLSGALKVFQYMITIMVALMMTQHAIERYWTSIGSSNTSVSESITLMQKIMLAVFVSYPLFTLLLIILSNNEIAIRRFMYYRLMSLQVIVDWQNTPFYKLWFFSYFLISFVLLNAHAMYAGIITRQDKTNAVFAQWSIMFMQSILLFMFWLNMVSMEDQLVPLNKVIENSPESAKELITLCDVVSEAQLKATVKQSYARKRAFKRLSDAEQDAAGQQLIDAGDSLAAFFDLNALRRTSKRRGTKEDLTAVSADYSGHCFQWFHDLEEWLDDVTFRKLYAWYFCLSFFSVYLNRLRRSHGHRCHASTWPYPGDVGYFWALGVVGSLCFLTVVAVEAYALWFLLFSGGIADEDKYGIIECKQCYNHLASAGDSCVHQNATDKCWGVALRGFCSVQNALINNYRFNTTQVQSLDAVTCAAKVP